MLLQFAERYQQYEDNPLDKAPRQRYFVFACDLVRHTSSAMFTVTVLWGFLMKKFNINLLFNPTKNALLTRIFNEVFLHM
jgi:hypothetical protein